MLIDVLCDLDACPYTASSQTLLLGVSAPSENPARPSHDQPTKAATTRLRYHWNDFFIRGPFFLSADSLDGFT